MIFSLTKYIFYDLIVPELLSSILDRLMFFLVSEDIDRITSTKSTSNMRIKRCKNSFDLSTVNPAMELCYYWV